jgi:hypothetical protein
VEQRARAATLEVQRLRGDPVALPKNDVVRVSPDTGRRMKATGVFDDSFWATTA